MITLHTHFLAWQQAERAATAAEHGLFIRQRNAMFDGAPDAGSPRQTERVEETRARALRADASELLRIFLEEARVRAAALRWR